MAVPITADQTYRDLQTTGLTDSNTTTGSEVNGTPPAIPPGCFAGRNLTCDLALNRGDEVNVNVQLACIRMEIMIRSYLGREVRLLQTDRETGLYQAAFAGLSEDDLECYAIQQAYHKCWWCARISARNEGRDVSNSFCRFEECNKPESEDPTVDLNATCIEMADTRDQQMWPATIDFCSRAEQAAHQCPSVFCDLEYLGANTQAKKRALVWMARVSSLLSFLGASYILKDILTDRKNRQTVYHRLLLGMATFDLVTALAWGFSTAPLPSDKFWVYGAVGSMTTCKIQGFLVQLGFTSVFYNLSLATYYVLVIVYAWKETALNKINHWLHGIPIAIGVTLAIGALPFYDWFEYGCHVLPPPQGSMKVVLIFAVVPIGFSILYITVCMGAMYWSVRSKAKASSKWAMGKSKGKANTLQTQVFYQSMFYIASFFISWPILFAVYLASIDQNGPYGISITVAFLAPMQGFNNFLVYIRPKVNQWRKGKGGRTSSQVSSTSRASLSRGASVGRGITRQGSVETLMKGPMFLSSRAKRLWTHIRMSTSSENENNSGMFRSSAASGLDNSSSALDASAGNLDVDLSESNSMMDPSVLIATTIPSQLPEGNQLDAVIEEGKEDDEEFKEEE